MSAGAQPSAASSPWQKLFRWLRVFLPFAVLLVLNPFGCSSVADSYSEKIALRVMAPFYGGRWQGEASPPSLGQQKVTVVLVDEASLSTFAVGDNRATWPPSRKDQLNYILRTITDRKPAAVLIDWTFHADTLVSAKPAAAPLVPAKPAAAPRVPAEPAPVDDIRPGLEEILRAPDGPRLLFGSKPLFKGVQSGCALQWVGLDQARAADDVAPRLRYWGKVERKAGTVPALPAEIVTLRSYSGDHYALLPYQLGSGGIEHPGKDCATFEPEAEYLAAPGYAMFMAYCDREHDRPDVQPLCARLRAGAGPHTIAATPPAVEAPPPSKPQADAKAPPKVVPQPSYFAYAGAEVAKTPIALLWPAFRTPLQTRIDSKLAKSAREHVEPSPDASDFQSLDIDIKKCRAVSEGWWVIPPAVMLSWRLLWSSAAVAPVTPCAYGVDVVTLRDLTELDLLPSDELHRLDPIRGRYVFLGLDLASVPDRIATPFYPHVPGVVLHAVAFENLVTLGDGVLHDSRERPLGKPGMTLAIFFLGLAMSLLAAFLPIEAYAAWIGGARLHPLRTPLVLALGFFFSVLLPLLLGITYTWFWGAAPINWVSIIPAMAWALEAAFGAVGDQIRQAGSPRRAGVGALLAGVIVVAIFLYWIE